MLTLLYKDFKLLFASGKTGKWRLLSYLISVLLLAFFIAVETFIVFQVLTRLASYVNAPLAFLSVALFAVSVLMIFVCLTQAKKLFFNEKDASNLSMMPVRSSRIIFSKLILLFLMQYGTGLMFTYPVIASYAAVFHRGNALYYLGLFYPVLAFPFECGVALLLVYPYKLLGDFLKKHPLVQFFTAVVVIFGLCYVYSRVLDVFVTLVASNNFDALLSADNIRAMIGARNYMIPVVWLVDIFFLKSINELVIYLPVAMGILALGAALCILSYRRLRFVRFHSHEARKTADPIPMSAKRALVKKEFILLFRDSDNLFSFTGLLVVQPFLVYLIVSSLNTIFTSGIFAYYVALLPNFLPVIDILLVILIGLIIAQGANNYIAGEAKNIRLIKCMPVSILLQLGVKVALPLIFVCASVFVTYLVLLAFGTVSVWTALAGFVLAVLIQIIFSMISLYEELKIRQNRARSYFFSSTFSYMLPIFYSAGMILASYFGLALYAVYLIGLALILASGLPWAIGFRARILRLFDELEVVN